MQAQRYRHRITLEERIDTQDPLTGAASHTWEVAAIDSDNFLSDVPAEVLTGPGREAISGGTKQAESTARINLRWFPGLDTAWRILHDDKIYDISSIETDRTGRREYRLRCIDGLSDGE